MDDATGSVESGNPAVDAGTTENQSQQTGAWYESMPEDMRGLVETKGWQKPEDAIQSYTNLEKLMGADKAGRGVVLPKEDADPSEWDAVYDRLGRPKSPDEYNIPVPENDTGEFATVAKQKFHELGLTAKQAESLAEWYNSQASEMQSQQMNAMSMNAEAELETLKKEWGPQYDANIESARRATKQFGVEAETLEKIENSVGTRKMLEMFSNIGKGLGEDSFVEGKPTNGFGMSPEGARVRINQLKADPEWSAKYLNGNADSKAELEKLMKVAYQ